MKNYINLSLFVTVAAYSLSAFTLEYETGLKQIKNHPLLQNAQLETEIAKESRDELRGNILPTINLRANYLKQDAAGNSFVQDEQQNYFLTLNQPLFRGLREFKVLDQAKLREQATALLYKSEWMRQAANYTTQFYDLVLNQKNQKLTQDLIKTSSAREKYLRDRVRIGRSRNSDLLTASGQTLRAQQSYSLLQNNEAILKESLIYSTSLDKVSNPKDTPYAEKNYQFDDLLSKLPSHPLMQARRFEVEIAKKEIGVQEGAHLPDIDLTGNYYIDRKGVFTQNKWDIAVNLTLPLYEGGKTVAASEKASLRLKQVMFNYKDTLEQLKLNLKNLFDRYQTSTSQLRLAKSASSLDQKRYQEFRKEYDLGLVSNLEVITALNQSIESQIEVIRLETEAKKLSALIEILVGDISEVN